MKRLTLLLTIVAMAAAPASAEAFPCRANGKTAPPAWCAQANMHEYMNYAYFRPVLKSAWTKPTSKGRFHSRWMANVPTAGGLFVWRRVTLTASRCRNTFVVFDHRKQQWSSRC